MPNEPLLEALRTLTTAIVGTPPLAAALEEGWRTGRFEEGIEETVSAAAYLVDREMPAWSRTAKGAALSAALVDEADDATLLWCAASAPNSDATLAAILAEASTRPVLRDRAREAAKRRVVEGPLVDALMCAPLLGEGEELDAPHNAEPRARMEILIWEAGAAALQIPELGKWIWASPQTFEVIIGRPARGSLRGRVLAARCLEVSVCGMSQMTDPQLVGRTLQVLQPLFLHPEPMVWIHAARAFGRMAGNFEMLEGTVLDWVHGQSPVLRQRALTAFASLPGHRLSFLGHELTSIIDTPSEDAWVLAAVAAATPYLFYEKRQIWNRLASRILDGETDAISARALARGLASLWRRGTKRDDVEIPYRRLRQMARRAVADEIDEWRRWLEVIAVTDPIDTAERDPLDIELGLENLVRLAAQYDDEEADARAARFAETLAPTFSEARRIVLSDGSLRHRAAAISAVEGCARSLALRLWGPMLATRPAGDPIVEPNLEETWTSIAAAPAELLDLVEERRQNQRTDHGFELALEVLALKLGGYALDACGEERDLGPGRGPTAHETCLWLRKLDGLVDGTREFPGPLKSALSALFWRLVDTTRGTALGEVDDVAWLGPFAAWWALVIDRPAILQQLGTALPMIAEGALEKCCALADATRAALSSGAPNGEWAELAMKALDELKTTGTELAAALSGLASALASFEAASGRNAELDSLSLELVLAAERLRAALADPVRALHTLPEETPLDVANDDSQLANAPRLANVVSRAIRAREIALLEVWFASLGPTVAQLVEAAVVAAVRRTPPPPPAPKKKELQKIGGYELVHRLGEGGIGSVWLVRKPGADRLFVLKIPKSEALASANEVEREGILASFIDEARALAGLYHPNVANIIDRGVEENVPYLVLEYLIGADLQQYSAAHLMSLFELRQIVVETCAGLTALHNAGLVHRDIKPANIWLRLPLAGGEKFDPNVHRDPAHTHPLNSVVIDFGMVRATKVAAEVGGKFVAGTPGYIAPEQVLDPIELDGRADVYALAGTIYNVTTGRRFFDDITDARERIIAHMRKDPMENLEPFKVYPAALIKLLRAATAHNFKDRPTPLEFGRAFVAAI